MKEEKKIEIKEELRKINITLYIIVACLGLIFTVLLFKDFNGSANNNNVAQKSDSDEVVEGYDVSKMNEVDLKGALALFDSKKAYVLYIGRSNCSACLSYVPNLNAAQEEMEFVTQYLDLNKMDRSSSDASKFYDKLDLKTTIMPEEEEITETYGYFFKEYGYTPVTIVINNGKMVAGNIGYMEKDEIITLLKNNGIK